MKEKEKKSPSPPGPCLSRFSRALSRAQWQPLHGLLKDLQRQRGRVERNLVAGAKYAQEAEITLRLERPCRGPGDRVTSQRCRSEGRLARERDRFRRHLVADPVADVIRVSGPLRFGE